MIPDRYDQERIFHRVNPAVAGVYSHLPLARIVPPD